MQKIEINGMDAQFTDERIEDRNIPEGCYKYDIRHNEEREPATIEERVMVDFFGSIITREPIEMTEGDYTPITSFGYLGEEE